MNNESKQPLPSRPARRARLTKKRLGLGLAAIIVVVGLAVVATLYFTMQRSDNLATDQSTPPFKAVLPTDKTIGQLGGWRAPDDGKLTYAFIDKIKHVPINVSQQPLPKSFKANPEASVADLAKSFNATDKIAAGDNTIMYVGTSIKGPQWAVLTKDGLLILIKSQDELRDADWSNYAKSLH